MLSSLYLPLGSSTHSQKVIFLSSIRTLPPSSSLVPLAAAPGCSRVQFGTGEVHTIACAFLNLFDVTP